MYPCGQVALNAVLVHVLHDGTDSQHVFAAHFPEWSRIDSAPSRLTRMGCCADESVRTLALARRGAHKMIDSTSAR